MNIRDEILKLKEERGAVILAHNYTDGAIQDIADFCGDSLELSIRAAGVKARVIVCCGVRFMAETAKLLSPDAVVLLPNSGAGCPMADMASAADVETYRREHPDTLLAAYVNTTAGTKAHVDICCTSGNADKILSSLPPGRKVMFLPDRNLGRNMEAKLGKKLELWNGCCPIHDAVTPAMIAEARKLHPGAPVLLHPECPPDAVEAADQALSTAGILKFVRESTEKEFIIGTECGILHRLRKENPGKIFFSLQPELVCRDMKKITLEDLRNALRDGKEEIRIPSEEARKAVEPIRKMIAVR